jgi:hypothetical protein
VKQQAENDASMYFKNTQPFRDLGNICRGRGTGSFGSSRKGKEKRQFRDARSEPHLREEAWRRNCESFYWNYFALDALLAGMGSPDADHDERLSDEDFSLNGGYNEDIFPMKFALLYVNYVSTFLLYPGASCSAVHLRFTKLSISQYGFGNL